MNIDEFEVNLYKATNAKEIKKLCDNLIEIRDFIDNLSILTCGKSFTWNRKAGPIYSNGILMSTAHTIESIRHCVLNANFADAFTLLRKYEDNLFYYLYVLVVTDNNGFEKVLSKEPLGKDEINISDWNNNMLSDLNSCLVLKYIAVKSSASLTIKKYNLHHCFNKIREILNNYVHSNGRSYYNEFYDKMAAKQCIEEKCNELSDLAIFITITFLILLCIIKPYFLVSYDYDISINNNTFAPFIADFIHNHKDVIDDDLLDYLEKETGMSV